MESGDGVRVEAAISSFSGGRIPPSSVGIHPTSTEERGRPRSNSPSSGNFDTLYKSVNLLTSLWFEYRGERIHADGFEDGADMKIIQFPVNIDKFTGFFDKYLKTNGEDIN